MDFELNEDQSLLRQTLHEFVDREIIPVAREQEQAGHYPTALVERMKALGLFGITVPEAYGGTPLDAISFALVFEELSRGWMGIAGILGSHTLACRIIADHGTEQQKRRYLPELASGERRSGIGLTEPDAGTDLQGIRTTARLDGEVYVVNGTKTWITNARHADPLPILVKTDPNADPRHRGMSILLVDAGTPGYTISKDLPKLGYKGPESCEVVLDGALVPAQNLLGDIEGRGMQQALSALETGRINVAARSVGIAQRALDESLAYARDRRAFGRPIADFQAIQLKLADLAIQVQAARLLTYWSADSLDRGKRSDAQTGMAKVFAAEAALSCAIDAMRIHGGYGYSTEYEIERLYRDSILMSVGEGTNDVLRTVIARSLTRADVRIE